jgi:hypothetical protein
MESLSARRSSEPHYGETDSKAGVLSVLLCGCLTKANAESPAWSEDPSPGAIHNELPTESHGIGNGTWRDWQAKNVHVLNLPNQEKNASSRLEILPFGLRYRNLPGDVVYGLLVRAEISPDSGKSSRFRFLFGAVSLPDIKVSTYPDRNGRGCPVFFTVKLAVGLIPTRGAWNEVAPSKII